MPAPRPSLALLVLAAACQGGDSATTPTDLADTGGADTDTLAGGTVDLGPGPYGVAYAGTDIGIDLRVATALTLQGTTLVGYEASADEAPTAGTNAVVDAGADGPLVWGRWAGGTTGGRYYTAPPFTWAPDGGLHHVAGAPTETLPASGGGAWTLAGSTSVTRSDGAVAPGTVTGTMSVAFAGQDTRVGLSLTLELPGDGTYVVETTGGSADPSASELRWQEGALFRDQGGLTATGGAACSAQPCFVGIAGLFAGPDADRAGWVIHLYSGGGGAPDTVSAAVVFRAE